MTILREIKFSELNTCFPKSIVWPEEWVSSGKEVVRICVDLDGCVVYYDFPTLVKKHFGVDIESKDIYAYDLPDVLGVSQEEIDLMFFEQVYGKPNFIEGAIETLKEWKSKLWKIIIYSNRVKYMSRDGLARWLIDYQIPFTDIDGGLGEYDVQIDDRPSKLENCDSKLKLLYTQPWNLGCLNIKHNLVRVNDWQDVRQAVNKEV